MPRKLYVLPVPQTAQQPGSNQQQAARNVAAQGLLNQDVSALESISTQPSSGTIRGQYRGKYAELMASELRELSNSSGFETVPYNAPDELDVADGYYSVENMDVGRADENSALVQKYNGSLSKAGTRASHYRSVVTNPRDVTHPFGSGTTVPLAIPTDAEARLWVNETTGKAQTATPVEKSRETELGFVDIFHLGDSPYAADNTELVYDVPYDHIGPTDVRVWDTQGHKTRDDGDGIPRWQKVFVSTHDFGSDPIVISSGLLRLTLDTDRQPGITAATLDPDGGELVGGDRAYGDDAYGDGIYTGHPPIYDSVSLGDSSWSLQEVDIGHRQDQILGPGRVDAHTRWLGPGGERYDLDLTVRRGQQSLLVARPPDETNAIPSGLQTLLSPIADSNVVHPQVEVTLRARSDVSTQ